MRRANLARTIRASSPSVAIRRSKSIRRLGDVRLAVFDIDGVLTDGRVQLDVTGSPFRTFDMKDGLGLVRMARIGIHLAAISSSPLRIGEERLEKLGFESINVGVEDKLSVLHDVCAQFEVSLNRTSYMGDDLPDICCLRVVGLSCAPRNAVSEVRAIADYVSRFDGGRGAIRSFADAILKDRVASEQVRQSRYSRVSQTTPRQSKLSSGGS